MENRSDVRVIGLDEQLTELLELVWNSERAWAAAERPSVPRNRQRQRRARSRGITHVEPSENLAA